MRLLLTLLCFTFAGCAQRDPEAELRQLDLDQRALISQDLGGGATIERVNPPVGPFRLVSRYSLYYHVVARDGEAYYAEAYMSKWTVASAVGGGDIIYRRRYYQRTLGVWHRVLQQ